MKGFAGVHDRESEKGRNVERKERETGRNGDGGKQG